jgi:hypothetical protein
LQLRVEHVAREDEHRPVDGDVIPSMDVADDAEMVSEGALAVERVEISKLGVVVESQEKGNLGVLGVLPDDDAILIVIVLLLRFDGACCADAVAMLAVPALARSSTAVVTLSSRRCNRST